MKYSFLLFLLLSCTMIDAQQPVKPVVTPKDIQLPKDAQNKVSAADLVKLNPINLSNPLCEYRPTEKVKYVFYDVVRLDEVTNRTTPEAGDHIALVTVIGGKEYTLIPANGLSIDGSTGTPQGVKLAEITGPTRIAGLPPVASLWKVTKAGSAFSLNYTGAYLHADAQWQETGGLLGFQAGTPKVGNGASFNTSWVITSGMEGGKVLQLQNATDNKLLGYSYSEGASVNIGGQTRRLITDITPVAMAAGETAGGKVLSAKWYYKIYKATKTAKAKTYPTDIEPGTYLINTVHDNKSLMPFINGVAFGETRPSMEDQQWQFEQTSRGTYFIISKKKNQALGVFGASLRPGFRSINTFNFYETDSLQWIIRGPFEGKYSFMPLLNDKAPNTTNALTTDNAVAVEISRYVAGSYWQEFMVDTLNGPLWGYTDMHTHPMSHLAFAGKNFHGAPDVGSMMFAGTIHRDAGFDVGETKKDCNTGIERVKSVADALGNCNATHGGWGTDNNCGDYLRNGFIGIMEGMTDGAVSAHGSKVYGYHPDKNLAFTHWPRWNDMTHQKMWVNWLEMAYQSGLRVMVALGHNNKVMSEIIAYNDRGTPKDDAASATLQVKEIIDFVNRHRNFMEVAYTSADLYRIVKSNKLAVVPGIEVDFMGNFTLDMVDNAENQRKVENELNRLYTDGVRYIFPIHLSDNAFGGTAIYEDLMNVMQKIATGTFWKIECSKPTDSITHKFEMGINRNITTALQAGLPLAPALLEGLTHLLPLPPGIKEAAQPILSGIIAGMVPLTPAMQAALTVVPDAPPSCGATGHRNARGLTPLGVFAIKKMMQKGMLIDVDHMSQYAVDSTLQIASRFRYPVNSGHTGVRPATENQRTYRQLNTITELGGLFGVGWSGQHAKNWVDNYKLGLKGMKNRGVCIGSDINSIVFTPKPRPGSNVQYTTTGFPAPSSYGHTWNYNTDGMAHYGMLRDFVRDIRNMGNAAELNVLFSSANEFHNMWKKCETQSRYVR